MSRNKLIADLLFWVQIVCGFILCWSQFFRLWETTQGQLLSMFLIMEVYMALHLMLARASHKAQPSRITRQTIHVYSMWIILVGIDILAFFLNGKYQWSPNDNRTFIIAGLGVLVVFAIKAFRNIGLQDPMLKSLIAIFSKASPQMVMAFEIFQKGGAGLPAVALVSGHITILIRVSQLILAIRENGKDRNRLWLFASEMANWLSWMIVTIAWLLS